MTLVNVLGRLNHLFAVSLPLCSQHTVLHPPVALFTLDYYYYYYNIKILIFLSGLIMTKK